MKKISILLGTLVVAVLLISANKQESSQYDSTLEGVWEQVHQTLYDNGQVTDTLYNMNGYRQVKIYSKGKVMWTRFDPSDTNEWFGYGSYTVKDGILEEHIEYASGEMMKIVDTTQVFRFKLEMSKNRYSQIASDANGNLYISENYIRLE